MKSRVTITLDPEVHRLAKRVAKQRKTTVSGLIESLLESETTARPRGIVSRMIGAASLREPAPGTDPLYDALRAKHVR
jgi:hypothetical protein